MAYTYAQLRTDPALYTQNKGPIELECEGCGAIFVRSKKNIHTNLYRSEHTFCSEACRNKANDLRQTIECDWCHRPVVKRRDQIRRTDHNFCNHSCAASYANTHKTHGTRRSKLEIWLEEQLRARYPNLEILFNAKEAITAELDIHFPSLDLAFELNGIYHYEPIHGLEKLASIQTNDHRKFAACAEKGISLCVIDVSMMKYFKPAKGQKFLDIIINMVDTETLRRAAESNG